MSSQDRLDAAKQIVSAAREKKPLYDFDKHDGEPSPQIPVRYKPADPFYDRDALIHKAREMEREKNELLEQELALEARYLALTTQLEDVSEEKSRLAKAKNLQDIMIAEAAQRRKATPQPKPKGREANNNVESRDGEQKGLSEDDFYFQDRVMELELLNESLTKDQARLEKQVRDWQIRAAAESDNLSRIKRTVDSAPRRFKQTLDEVQAEVRLLVREKDKLEEEKRVRLRRKDKDTGETRRRLGEAKEELENLREELDEIENERDTWAQRLRSEEAQTEAVSKQRSSALDRLHSQYGHDAIEKCAFSMAARGTKNIPISSVKEALRSYYAPDFDISDACVSAAIRECGVTVSVTSSDTPVLNFEQFVQVANALKNPREVR